MINLISDIFHAHGALEIEIKCAWFNIYKPQFMGSLIIHQSWSYKIFNALIVYLTRITLNLKFVQWTIYVGTNIKYYRWCLDYSHFIDFINHQYLHWTLILLGTYLVVYTPLLCACFCATKNSKFKKIYLYNIILFLVFGGLNYSL